MILVFRLEVYMKAYGQQHEMIESHHVKSSLEEFFLRICWYEDSIS